MLALLLLLANLQPGMVRIEGGAFRPLYALPGHARAQVATFALDTLPVSAAQYVAFARQQPRHAVAGMRPDARRPATRVSWAAAEAYCRARGARLPTTYEWEYAARADERSRTAGDTQGFRQRVLELAIRTRPATYTLGSGLRNIWGVRDLHGGLNEWTHDYNGHLGEHHGHGGSTTQCASGTVQTGDPGDYAAFMRYSYRTHANAQHGAANTGFRCAMSL
jgi:formylglycine-generating enzyme required for sulfatase activity